VQLEKPVGLITLVGLVTLATLHWSIREHMKLLEDA
jgi:hypothetical protein